MGVGVSPSPVPSPVGMATTVHCLWDSLRKQDSVYRYSVRNVHPLHLQPLPGASWAFYMNISGEHPHLSACRMPAAPDSCGFLRITPVTEINDSRRKTRFAPVHGLPPLIFSGEGGPSPSLSHGMPLHTDHTDRSVGSRHPAYQGYDLRK